MISRREFMKKTVDVAKGLAILSLPLGALATVRKRGVASPLNAVDAAVPKGTKVRWGLLVNADKCLGCGLCVEACKRENDIPLDANVSRTWVERYVVTKEGEVLADSPHAGRLGFTDKRIDQGEAGMRTVADEDVTKCFFVPKTCNHCENPPCAQVCPVGATYQTEDGVVLVDRKTCIGCGYCIMACPYGARFFHPVTHTADKCTFCYHRITKGMQPACVEVCPAGARLLGNLKDPDDPVAKTIASEKVSVLKDEYGTKPQVYYIGLSKEVR